MARPSRSEKLFIHLIKGKKKSSQKLN